MAYINNKESSPVSGRLLGIVTLITACSACTNQSSYELQAEVDTIGDAMAHCRGYTTHLMPKGTRIALDEWSSRETREYYEIYFDLTDATQSGYAKCRVDKNGLITYHGTRDFRQKSKSFAAFLE